MKQDPDLYAHLNDGLSPKGYVHKDGEWYAQNFAKASTIEERLHNFFDFARERHAIFLRRARGVKKPWTRDPILSSYRFCNIYRELDTVSLWIRDNIILPYEDHADLWFMLCMARVINWPDSLQEMMDVKGAFPADGRYNSKIAFEALMSRRKRGLKTITGAYIINSVTSKKDPPIIQGNKLAYIAYRTLGEIWEDREKLRSCFKETLQKSVETLKKYQGYGPFIAYQVTVDLSYTKKWLGNAPDYNTFNSAGPGTCRGLSQVFHGQKFVRMDDAEKTKLLSFQLRASKNERYWPNTSKDMTKGFAPLSMSNVSNCNCEFSKHLAVALGIGKMRSSYPGRPTHAELQRSLF